MSRPVGPASPAPTPASGRVRLGRVVALGLASWALGTGAHVAAGGGWPGWPVTILLVLALGIVAVAVTGRRRGPASLVVLLGIEQTVLHLVLSTSGGAAPCLTAATHHGASVVCTPGPEAMAMPNVWMLIGHALATLGTAWLLARGEAWLWRTVRRLFALPVRVALLGNAEPVVGQPVAVLSGRTIRRARPRGPPAYPLLLVLH